MATEGPPGVRYVRDVSPADVGVRVVLRRSTGSGASDVLGVLRSWTGGALVVERRDGALVTVPESEVLALKRVPPPPAPRGRR